MSTLLASYVYRSDLLGFGMFSGLPSIFKGWNAVHIPHTCPADSICQLLGQDSTPVIRRPHLRPSRDRTGPARQRAATLFPQDDPNLRTIADPPAAPVHCTGQRRKLHRTAIHELRHHIPRELERLKSVRM